MKRALALAYVLTSLWWGPAAEAAFHLEKTYESSGGIGTLTRFDVEGSSYRPPQAPVRKPLRAPVAPVARSVVGKCYAEPGTPPASVLWRESRGNPTVWNQQGSSASGCWQFLRGTWGGFKGYPNAASAPVEIQNQRAKQVWAGGAGCRHWNAC